MMTLKEFIDVYCKDLTEEFVYESLRDPISSSDFSYDAYDEIEGKLEKVVFSESGNITVKDIIDLEECDFVIKYPLPGDLETYHNYLSSFVILYGEEVLQRTKQEIERLKLKLQSSANFDASNIFG